MNFEEIKSRRDNLLDWLIDLHHGIWNDPVRGKKIERWIGREIDRYDDRMDEIEDNNDTWPPVGAERHTY